MRRALALTLVLSAGMAGCASIERAPCESLVVQEHAARGSDGLWRFDVVLTACEKEETVVVDGCRPLAELYPTIEVDGRIYHVGYAREAVPAEERSCDPLYDPVASYRIAHGTSAQATGLTWSGSIGEREGDPDAHRLSGSQTLRVDVAGHQARFVVDVGP